MNPFYDLGWYIKWPVAIGFPIAAFAPLFWIPPGLERAFEAPLWVALVVTAVSVVGFLPVIQASITPICTLTGYYRYYSPMLLSFGSSGVSIGLHVGTWWDLAFLVGFTGPRSSRQVLIALLDGLIAVADDVANGAIDPDTAITGTSYFFSERTLQRMGFQSMRPALFWRIILAFSIVDLSSQVSFLRGRLTVARVWRVRAATTTGAELLAHRDAIARIRHAIARKR
jgi:hypothetical protein